MKNPESMNSNLKPRSKDGTIILYLLGPCFISIMFWFGYSLYTSHNITWIILLLINIFIGVFTTLMLKKNKRAYQFFLTRSIWIICADLPLIYLCYLGLSYWLGSKTAVVFFLIILTSLIGWAISFIYAKDGFSKNIEININKGVIDLETAQWNIQYSEVLSAKDNDSSRMEKIRLLSRFVIPLAPPIYLLIVRDYPSDKQLSLMAILIAYMATLLFSISGLSVGLSQSIRDIERRIKKKIMIKSLE
jgi:hypothetical protein